MTVDSGADHSTIAIIRQAPRDYSTKESDKTKTPDKLDKFLASGNITLNCLISDEGVNDIFEVTISNANNNRVSSLAEAIRTSDSVIINDLRNISEFEVEGAIRMEPQDTIFTHFPIQPQRIFGGEKGINVIVYPPAERVPEVLSKDN
ncbi:5266_t:CDS:2 [Funneliformis caledonium]|uniref:5266_t:CDS:1 n=1 Tax=Funneliformis caledonium TaxID=1117310 RepID=A0A9N9DRF6_9GLOM|nr:5266_t:CDS:2 [Funneliformis caledonium]